jgi:hypothetical protein
VRRKAGELVFVQQSKTRRCNIYLRILKGKNLFKNGSCSLECLKGKTIFGGFNF